jgi:addiction module HigA family antidote
MSAEMPPDVAIEPVFIIEATYAPDAAELRRPVRAEHLARAARLRDDGTIIEVGAYADMSASELSRQLKVPTNRVTAIVNGQRAITGDTALRLGHFFGTSAEFWLNLQANHDAWEADKAARKLNIPRFEQASAS